MNDRDSHIIDQSIDTMIAFLNQSKLVIKVPSVTRNKTSKIYPVKIEGFCVNPKVYLSHPRSKKKCLIPRPNFFYDGNIFTNNLVEEMIHRANVGVFWPNKFFSGLSHYEINFINNTINKRISKCK